MTTLIKDKQLQEDTTPTLAGDLDCQDNKIINANMIGIGQNTPSRELHVFINRDAFNLPVILQNYEDSTSDNSIGIGFLNDIDENTIKGAIVFDRRTSWGRGNFHILNNGAEGPAHVGITDAKLTVSYEGFIGINIPEPTHPFDINLNQIRIRNSFTPASSTDVGEAGTICWDENYLYVCTSTNVWKRISLDTW